MLGKDDTENTKKPDQKMIEYWEDQLEVAEIARNYALRMLGRLAIEENDTENA